LLFYSREKAHHVSRAYSNLPSRWPIGGRHVIHYT
jgi:hypothetical protein